jgi:pyrroloquinoline quinone (PQQ) biosynthesis protein C
VGRLAHGWFPLFLGTGIGSSANEYRKLGAKEVALNTMGAGLRAIDEHIAALRRFAEALGLERRQ